MRDFSVRLALIAAVLLGLSEIFGAALVAPVLPALASVIEAAGQGFRVDRIEVVKRQTDTVIQLKVTPTRPVIVGERVLLPDARLFFEPSTLVGSVLQPMIVFLSILLAWPAGGSRAVAMRSLLAIPVGMLLVASNVPLGLVGAMLDYRPFFPALPVHPLAYWNDFLQSGGPSGMAIAAALLVGSAADRWRERPAERNAIAP